MDNIQTQICKYFNGRIIGSYMFVTQKLLTEDQVNDIDIMVSSVTVQNVRRFLNDNGYKETDPYRQERGYAPFDGSKVFIKDGFKPIHLLDTRETLTVFTIGELIASKYDRKSKSDIDQLQSVLKNTPLYESEK